MASTVFANGMEVSCKAAAGKTICAFPDVCFTPPQTPATPPGVPIPYPNTGLASDTADGSKKVKIGGKEVGLKNKSNFKKSSGDEAGSAPKKGVVTSKNTGKVYFNSWSMNVKFEGENAVRHFDLTTNNHAGSVPGDTPTWPYIDRMAMGQVKPCVQERKEVQEKCKVDNDGNVKCPDASGYHTAQQANDTAREALKKAEESGVGVAVAQANKTAAQAAANESHMQYSKDVRDDKCNKAARCMLVPWDKKKCCKPQTPHHLVFKASFKKGGKARPGCDGYDADKAPCICATGGASSGTHGLIHAKQKDQMVKRLGGRLPNADDTWKCGRAERVAAQAVHDLFPQCSRRCIQAQLRSVHQKMGVDAGTQVGMVTAGASQESLAPLKAAFRSP